MRREPLVSREELIKEGLSFLKRVDGLGFFFIEMKIKGIIFISFEIGNRFSGTNMLISIIILRRFESISTYFISVKVTF